MADTSQTDSYLKQFEADVFWEQHGRKVIWALVAIVTVGVIAYLMQWQAAQKAEAAATKLAAARDVAGLEAVLREYPRSEVGAQALLRLADLHYTAGRYQDAAQAYEKFLTDYPQHSLAGAARLGLAAVQEAQGNFDAARSQYTQIATAGGFTALAARLGVARCTELVGQTKEARLLYEELLPAVQGTPWQAEVYLRWTVLGRNVSKETPPPATAPTSLLPVAP